MKNINNQLKNKVLNFVAALVCGAIGGNVFIYSVGQIFILKGVFFEEYLFGPLLAWTCFGVGFVFLVAAVFFIRECFRRVL